MSVLRSIANRTPLAMDLLRLARSPRDESKILLDTARTWRELAFLRREMTPPVEGAPVVLVPLLSDWVFATKMHLQLATALRLEGWRVVVLLENRRSRVPRRYAAAFGIRELAFLDDMPPGDGALRAEAEAARLLQGDLSFRTVKEWTFDGAWIGPQLLSTIARTGMSAPDPGDPAVRTELERLLPTTLRQVVTARAVFERIQPSLCVVNEPNYALTGALVDAAVTSGIDVIHFTQPWRDDALMCKRLTSTTRRMHPSSLSRETLDVLDADPWTPTDEAELWDELGARYDGTWFLQGRNQVRTRSYTRGDLIERLGLDPGKPIAVVFVHVLWDANLFYGEDLFEDYADWFARTVEAVCANPNINWLLKLHPANEWKREREGVERRYVELDIIDATVPTVPPNVHLLPPDTDISTLALFELAHYGITVRGTPGMEHACFGATVVTAGTGRYSGLGFTTDPASREEYLATLANLHAIPAPTTEQTRRAKRHAHAVFRRRPWVMRSFRPTFRRRPTGARPLDENLHPVATSVAEIRRLGDLRAWAQWAGSSTAVDYISPGDADRELAP